VRGLGVDEALLADRLERLLRDVEAAHLLLDARARRVALVVPSALPLPLLELAVAALFRVLHTTAVSVLPSNVMSVVGAGLRAALVLDIGWAETTVSAIYEFREVSQRRTVRASKSLVREYATVLKMENKFTVEEIEDILIRLGWCREKDAHDDDHTPISISLPGLAFQVPRSSLAEPPDTVLFANGTPNHDLDDHELPLHLVAYAVLLQLPADVRKACMSRIVVTGGASNIPGVKRRILQELEHLVEQRGWDRVNNYGTASKKRPADILAERSINVPPADRSQHQDDATRTHLAPQEPDLILAKIHQQQRSRNDTPAVPASVGESAFRAVHSLGPWAGASLMSGLRVRGVVEIERERFLASGLLGGAQRREVSVAQQRQSVVGGAGMRQVSGSSERGGAHWTLGVWA
jgi:actin-related protein